MKVILIQDVQNLGKMCDSVNVKAGYGRNFLIPNNGPIVFPVDHLFIEK